MNRAAWWLVNHLSRFLDPAERDAVRGDLAESGVSGGRALREIFGLVARRQIDPWRTDWRPSLALFGIAIPLAFVLAGLARYLGHGSAIYLWLYWSNARLTDFGDAGFRYSLAKDLASIALGCVTLTAWSWAGGFALGSLSRRTAWLTSAFFAAALLFAPWPPEPDQPWNAPVFSMPFYRATWPLILESLLVLLPTIWGAYRGARRGALPLPWAIVWTLAIASLTARWYWGPGTHKFIWFLTLALLTWPAAYMIFISGRRISRSRHAN